MLSTLGSIAGQNGLPQNTVSLLHFDTPNLLTYDSILKSNAWFISGGWVLNTAAFKFGTSSAKNITASNACIYKSISSSIRTGDFTIELWVNPTNTDARRSIINNFNYAGSNYSIELVVQTGGNLSISVADSASTTVTISSVVTISANVFSFIRIGRKGNILFLIVNGIKYTQTLPTNFTMKSIEETINIGGVPQGDWNSFIGNIDELLIQIGTGNDSTTIPTSAY